MEVSKLSKMDRLFLLDVHQEELKALQPIITNLDAAEREEKLAQFRIVVRTLHSVIESTLALMASTVLRVVEDGSITVTEKEENYLRDRGYSKFSARARCIIKYYAEVHGGLRAEGRQVIKLPEKVANWIPFRHRITHPKKPSDFSIKHSDVDAFGAVMKWYLKASAWVIDIEKADTEATFKTQNDMMAEFKKKRMSGELAPEDIEQFKKRFLKTME